MGMNATVNYMHNTKSDHLPVIVSITYIAVTIQIFVNVIISYLIFPYISKIINGQSLKLDNIKFTAYLMSIGITISSSYFSTIVKNDVGQLIASVVIFSLFQFYVFYYIVQTTSNTSRATVNVIVNYFVVALSLIINTVISKKL